VADLLDGLRQAGADEQAAALTGGLPAAGMFQLFLEQEGLAEAAERVEPTHTRSYLPRRLHKPPL